MPQAQMSRKELSGYLKQRFSQLAPYSDDEVVDKVLERRPELRGMLAVETKPETTRSEGRGLIETLQHTMESEAFRREILASKGKHPRLEAALTTFSPNVVASMAKLWRGLASPTGVATTAAAVAAPEVTFPYLAYTGVQEALKERQSGESLPDYLERVLLAGSQVAGGLAGSAGARTIAAPRDVIVGKAAKGTARVLTGTGGRLIKRAERARAAEVQTATEKANLGARRDTLTRQLDENVKSTHKTVRDQFDKRWDALRDQVGGDTPVDYDPVVEGVEYAQNNILRGSAPESIKLFRDILRATNPLEEASIFQGTPGSAAAASLKQTLTSRFMTPSGLGRLMESLEQAGAGEMLPGRGAKGVTVEFNDARGDFTKIGERMASGRIPGDVYRALRHVRNVVDRQVRTVTDAKGATAEYELLKRDWSRYMDDWHDMSAVARGGSPLARSLRAADPEYSADPFLGKAGERAMQTLARYKEYGGKAELASSLRQIDSAFKKFPKSTPAPGDIPPVDPQQVRLEALRRRGESLEGLHWTDFASVLSALRGYPIALWLPIVRRVVGRALTGTLGERIARD